MKSRLSFIGLKQYKKFLISSVAFLITIMLITTGCEDNQRFSETKSINASNVDQRPNILLIVADDLGYTDVGFFGSEIATPNLDSLAYAGVRLTNFHVAPMCFATRAMLMSGRTYREAGLNQHNDALRTDIMALPERLSAAGYHTYMAGKWNLGIQAHEGPAERGFESSYALLPPADNHLGYSNFPESYNAYRENGEPIKSLPEDWFSSSLFTDKLISYIDANKKDNKPWFGYLAFTAPHLPLQVPDHWIDRYAGRYEMGYDEIRKERVKKANFLKIFPENLNLNNYKGQAETWNSLSSEQQIVSSRAMEIYAAMVESMDFHIGRLIDYLKDTSSLDNTVILFMSDNGASGSDSSWRPKLIPRSDWDNSLSNMGREGSWTAYGRGWGEAATAPYRELKGSLYSGGTLAATFVNHNSIKNSGGFDRRYLTVMDILPTFLDIANMNKMETGLKTQESPPVRGRSFWKQLQGEDIPVHDKSESIPWMTSETKQALVRWPWKIIQIQSNDDDANTLTGDRNKWLLFNLVDDPGETINLANQYPKIQSELIAQWLKL